MKRPINYYYYYYGGDIVNKDDEIEKVLGFIKSYNNYIQNITNRIKEDARTSKIDTLFDKKTTNLTSDLPFTDNFFKHSDEVFSKVNKLLDELRSRLSDKLFNDKFYENLELVGLTKNGLAFKLNSFFFHTEKVKTSNTRNNIISKDEESNIDLGSTILNSIIKVLLKFLDEKFGLTLDSLDELGEVIVNGVKRIYNRYR